MTNWNCVETRIDNGTKYGRIVRKIVFGDIFANRSQLLSQNPLNNNHKKLLKVSYFLFWKLKLIDWSLEKVNFISLCATLIFTPL